MALSLLSTLPPDRLAHAVADGDATALAKRRDSARKAHRRSFSSLSSIDLSQIETAASVISRPEDTGSEQVVEGLISLGWRQQDALHAVQEVCRSNDIATPPEQ